MVNSVESQWLVTRSMFLAAPIDSFHLHPRDHHYFIKSLPSRDILWSPLTQLVLQHLVKARIPTLTSVCV